VNSKPGDQFELKGKGANAQGVTTENGFLVRAGSIARKEIVPSGADSVTPVRKRLLLEGVLIDDGDSLRFVNDYLFDSPSGAAAAVLGRTANGWIEWKNADGEMLSKVKRVSRDGRTPLLTDSQKQQVAEKHQELVNEGKLPPQQQLDREYARFRERFGPSVLSGLNGEALLNLMHDHSNHDSLVYWLEFKNDEEFETRRFGSIAGGSALKFRVFRRKETGTWQAGGEKANRPVDITTEEAIEYARTHRDQLLRGVELLEELPENASDDDYAQLQDQMDELAPDVSRLAWGHKYFSLLFPDKLDDYHSPEWQRYILLKLLQLPPEGEEMVKPFSTDDLPSEEPKLLSIAVDERAEKLLFATTNSIYLADLTGQENPIEWTKIGDVADPRKSASVQCLPRHPSLPDTCFGLLIKGTEIVLWNLTTNAKIGKIDVSDGEIEDLKVAAIDGEQPRFIGIVRQDHVNLHLVDFSIEKQSVRILGAKSQVTPEDGWRIHDSSISANGSHVVVQLVHQDELNNDPSYQLILYSIVPATNPDDVQPNEELDDENVGDEVPQTESEPDDSSTDTDVMPNETEPAQNELQEKKEEAPWKLVACDRILRPGQVAQALRLVSDGPAPPTAFVLEDKLTKIGFQNLSVRLTGEAIAHLAMTKTESPKLLVALERKDFDVFPADLSGNAERIETETPIRSWTVASHEDFFVTAFESKLQFWTQSDLSKTVAVDLTDIANVVALSPDDERLYVAVSQGSDETQLIKVFETDQFTELQQFASDGLDEIVGLVPFRSSSKSKGDKIVSSTVGGKVQDWEERLTPVLRLGSHPGAVYSSEFSSDGKFIVTGCADGAIRVWKARAPDQGSLEFSFAPKGGTAEKSNDSEDSAISDDSDGASSILEAADASKPGCVYGIAVDSSSPTLRIVAVNQGGNLFAWSPPSNLKVKSHQVTNGPPLYRVTVQPNGNLVAVGSGVDPKGNSLDRQDMMRITLHNRDTLDKLDEAEQLAPWPSNSIYGLKFSDDGSRIAAVDIHGKIAVWDANMPTTEAKTERLPDKVSARALAWHPTMHDTFSIAGSDGAIYVYQVK